MTKEHVRQYAKFVAVGNGTLTKDMSDRLQAGDNQLAIDIMNGRIAELRSRRAAGIPSGVSDEDIETMIGSVQEAIAVLKP